MSKTFGIDLGTTNTRIYVRGKGIVVNEPTVVAMEGQRLREAGDRAKRMQGKSPAEVSVSLPVQGGVIADFDLAYKMLDEFYTRASGTRIAVSRPSVIMAAPIGITTTERRAFCEAAEKAGAKNVCVVNRSLAAAVGSRMKINEPKGKLIVDVGGGLTEVAVISYGGIVTCQAKRFGGDDFDRTIAAYIKNRYGITVGIVTAERVKKSIASVVYPTPEDSRHCDIHGSNGGQPMTVTITTEELVEEMNQQAETIVECIRQTIEKTPPDLCADIAETGIVLTGGGSLMPGLDSLIEDRTGLKTSVDRHSALTSVAEGLGTIIEKGDKMGLVMKPSRG